ncbi:MULTISPECIES: conditioned medium-induced protein 4 [Haloprofundus]|uniref:conditioned medium-induced protein 4 n=1 Tax=Haloprofundus TaxID=1911573 RepID=UPI000E4502CA|nr:MULTISPECIES: conditioned medium-induced protein 4 [Haloprofundus]QCJ47003.1 conditioned medium-induced protein 4 [Haloprofundus sp. MHR1]
MDEKTAELRDIFIDATGSDTVTESQEEGRGSLTEDEENIERRLDELVTTMRNRYEFANDLETATLVQVVRGFYDEQSDEELAAELNLDESELFDARMDLHLVSESDRDAPFALDELRTLVVDDVPMSDRAAELDSDESTVRRYSAVVEADQRSTRANDRFRDEFAELLTDSDLSARLVETAREDGLKEATEDIETNVSF